MDNIYALPATNLAIALTLSSIGAATVYALVKTRESVTIKLMLFIYSLFYFVLASNRLVQFLRPHPQDALETATNYGAAALGLMAAAVVWPVIINGSKKPSIREMEETNAQLETAKKHLEHHRDLFDRFMNYGPVLSAIKDQSGKFLFLCKRSKDLFNLKEGDFDTALGLPDAQWRNLRESDRQVIEEGKVIESTDYTECPKDKTGRHWFSVRFPIDTPDNDRYVGTMAVDITSLKEAEKVIANLNEELADRVYQLAEANAQLQIAKEHALEVSELKTAFLSNISHELRTPLSGIIGMNEILLTETLTPNQKMLSQTVQNSAEQLLAVVNDVLDLSKLEAGKMRLEMVPFNITYLIHSVSRQLSPGAKNKGITISTHINQSIPEFLWGDPGRVRQVLTHLIGNALKFTERGLIDINATILDEDDDFMRLCFSVKDTGRGVEKGAQRLLFQPFMQEDNSNTRKYGGPGLGLTISKRFVEVMGGEIGFESEFGKGSTFWFAIPFPKREPKTIQRQHVSWTLPHALKALVVEDNDTLQVLATKQLESLGIECDIAETGRIAVEKHLQSKYDLILMDCHLPELSGFEATEIIREREQITGVHVPIIALTAAASKQDAAKCAAAGMDAFLAKPVLIDELKTTIKRFVFSQAA